MPGWRSCAACWVAESPPDSAPDSPRKAVVIVLLRDDRVLLIRRAPGVPRAGTWSPPTGRIEAAESAEHAVVREAQEELGIVVEPLHEVWTSHTDDRRYRLAWWLVRHRSGTLRPHPDEVAELRWANREEFLALAPTFPQHRPFFDDILPRLVDGAPWTRAQR